MTEPLGNDDAKAEALRRLNAGQVVITSHFRRAAIADGVLPASAPQMIVSGFVQLHEFVDGSWRYRFACGCFVVVVAFRGQDELRMVTLFKR